MPNKIYDYYVLVFHPDHPRAEGDGYVPEHIIVMEDHLGRVLGPDEDVKHVNGNPQDNNISNLRVVGISTINKPLSILDSQEPSRRLSKTFVPCKYQRPCWKNIRAPIAKKNKIYLPYVCSYQIEGDVYKCSHFWNFKRDDIDSENGREEEVENE